MSSNTRSPIPPHLPLYDAHCHPTDTMSLIPSIPNMRARALTIMATRSQDQHLVHEVAEKYGVKSPDIENWGKEERVIPSFGWHPWFAHELYIDSEVSEDSEDSQDEKTKEIHSSLKNLNLSNQQQQQHGDVQKEPKNRLTDDTKTTHYLTVLRPHRSSFSVSEIKLISALPDPTPLSLYLSTLRANLQSHPYALVGEIGLDSTFRLPYPWTHEHSSSASDSRDEKLTIGGREGRKLTPFRVDLSHQKRVMRAQLDVAAELGRAVSVHGVRAHGAVLEVLQSTWEGHLKHVPSKRERKKMAAQKAAEKNASGSIANPEDENTNGKDEEQQLKQANNDDETSKPYPPRICLHSYSGTASTLQLYLSPSIPAEIFFSFSTAINLDDDLQSETPEEFLELVKKTPDHMLLIESDLHTAGERMDERLEDIATRICEIKGWGVEEGVRRLAGNWERFVFGDRMKEEERK
ncbi:Metallo-dependent hydrolase [Sporormia fimetaria CBS 119925]|uniref:Metallo-dependent hydrolase n=1 Tax=Sporormia fimetaria CBS 119925 TaxID=1340428 RepID=A0A6A6VEA4_9PLEO|nr:Metallo-dependent hydrolase [Sporormia fimetaria CBS 119925]